MDALALNTLHDELRSDLTAAQAALVMARERFAMAQPIPLEACAHQLVRLYNIIEQTCLRIARAFENRIDGVWHANLIQRLSIHITGIRPAFIPAALKQPLRELRGFRHLFVHAYELELDRDRMSLLLRDAATAISQLPSALEVFILLVRAMHDIPPSEPRA